MNQAAGTTTEAGRPENAPRTPYPPRWVATVLRVNAALFVAFFGIAFVVVALEVPLGHQLGSLTQWGQHGRAYELMITSLYTTWGYYLWIAARSPLEHRLFLGFTVTGNVVHFSVMLLEAVLMPGEHLHLVGVVLVGWISVISLAVAVQALRAAGPRPLSRRPVPSARRKGPA